MLRQLDLSEVEALIRLVLAEELQEINHVISEETAARQYNRKLISQLEFEFDELTAAVYHK